MVPAAPQIPRATPPKQARQASVRELVRPSPTGPPVRRSATVLSGTDR